MRSITTNWNNSAYNSAGTFVDVISGNTVTIPANTPVNFRAMVDSVEAGAYVYNPSSVVANPDTLSTVEDDVDTTVVTVTLSSVAVENAPIKASTSNAAVATVSPAKANANASGQYTFTITSVGSGSATITFTSGTATDTLAVTVA